MAYLTPTDLAPFAEIDEAKAEAMIADAVAQAILAAPCLATEADLDDNQLAAVLSVLRGAVLRWDEVGAGGAVTQHQQTAGPFSDGKTFFQPQRRTLFWPSEIEQLQTICAAVSGAVDDGAFAVDTAPCTGSGHALICSINFGANYCSCGADLTNGGGPLWGSE